MTFRFGQQVSQTDTDVFTVNTCDYITVISEQESQEIADNKALEAQFKDRVVRELAARLMDEGAIVLEYEYDVYRQARYVAARVRYLTEKE